MPDPHTQLRTIIKSQYHAAIDMLRQAIEPCPDDAWLDKTDHPAAFWHIAYHAIFFTHLYLSIDEAAFKPWEHTRKEYQFFDPYPWRDPKPRTLEPYTREQMLDYLQSVDAMVDDAVDGFDLDSPESGFPWYKLSKLEHQFINIRHVQHHAAQLADRLRLAANTGTKWISAKK